MKNKIIIILLSLFTSITIVDATTIMEGNNSLNIIQANQAELINNSNGTLTAITTDYDIDTQIYEGYLTLTQGGYGGAISFPIIGGISQNIIYSITAYIGIDIDSYNNAIINNSRYNNTGLGICNIGYCISNWNNGSYLSNIYYSSNNGYSNITIVDIDGVGHNYRVTPIVYIFSSTANANGILIPFASNNSWTNKKIYFLGYTISALGNSNTITQNDLNIAISNSGLATATSVQNTYNAVLDVQNELGNVDTSIQNQTQQQHADSQAEINAANQNSQEQIDSQKICTYYDKSSIYTEKKYLNNNGALITSTAWGTSDYIQIVKANIKILYNELSTPNICFYNTNKDLISCTNYGTITSENIIIPSGASYTRFSINTGQNKPQFEICKNGNQGLIDADSNYNNNASEEIQGGQDVEDTTELEESIMEDLDFSGANNINVTINGETSNFIWGIVERLRGINVAIVTLWTSILGLGVIKMILNR